MGLACGIPAFHGLGVPGAGPGAKVGAGPAAGRAESSAPPSRGCFY